MESSSRPVVVKRMPERINLKQARKFHAEVQPFLHSDRPQIVFDMSQVKQIDAAGVDVLLKCMREAVKRDGDLKLAAPSPQASVVLELTRAGRLFEIYETSTAAVSSFHSFLPNAMKQFYPQPAPAVLPTAGPAVSSGTDNQEGTELAA
jgi:anti-sigma B factor antagonist